MKAIVKTDITKVGATYQDMPFPQIEPDELLIKLRASALCASDLDVYYSEPSFLRQNLKAPFIMGHELCGEVMEVGSAVKGYEVGDLVASDSHLPCGTCYLCKNGMRHLCMTRGVLGRHKNGCFAEYMALPAVAAFKLPADFAPEEGALLEPFGVAVHAAQVADLSGKSVMILGMGTIGMMQIDVARLMGACSVIVCSTQDEKLAIAKEQGADYVINSKKDDVVAKVMEITGGRGVDCAIDMTGAVPLMNLAVDCLRNQGKLICVGIPNEPVSFDAFANRVMYKEIAILSLFGRLMDETWEVIDKMIKTNKVDFSKYVAKVMPLSEFDEAIRIAPKTLGRIVFKP